MPSSQYNHDYMEKCFYAWYNAGRPVEVIRYMPPFDDGNVPNKTTIYKWKKEGDWEQRADALDAQLSVQIDAQIIERKKQDYQFLAETGRDVLVKAKKYLLEEGFDSAASAVRAVGLGADMVAKYSRAAEMVDSIIGLSDKQLQKELHQLLSKVDVLDGDEGEASAGEENSD